MDSTSLKAFAETFTTLGMDAGKLALIVVDHGSRRDASNEMLLELVTNLRDYSPMSIIEPAHMELAEPSIDVAYQQCVAQGAEFIVVHPYFLLPGRHWNEDIPQLVAAAAKKHPATKYLVTAPLGLHPLMMDVIHARVAQCLKHAQQQGPGCDLCDAQDDKCVAQSFGDSRH